PTEFGRILELRTAAPDRVSQGERPSIAAGQPWDRRSVTSFGGSPMRMRSAALPILIGFLAGAAPALADSVAVTSGSDGTVIVNGKPCRVITCKNCGSGSNSTTITSGSGGLSGSTT